MVVKDDRATTNAGWLREGQDLRGSILDRNRTPISDLDLKGKYKELITSTFDTRTRWPAKDRLPAGFNHSELLETGKNPGLGIRELHGKGITGIGVKVAIIDQPLLHDHVEYQGKFAQYESIGCDGVEQSMHGPAVASLLVGKSCGTAPGASLYFWAAPFWEKDYAPAIEAMRRVIDYNSSRSDNERIKVVSISKGYDNAFKNLPAWKRELNEADRQGLLVVHCSSAMVGLQRTADGNVDDPSVYEICNHSLAGKDLLPQGLTYVPIEDRTTASPDGREDFTFWGTAGLSWAPPYLAGVLALGFQANPKMAGGEAMRILHETGTPFNRGMIVNPVGFVKAAVGLNG